MAIITNNDDRDHLTRLAPELQHMIFDHLLPSHEPDKAFDNQDTPIATTGPKKPNTHPLDYLAATCKALRDEVNEWALHFLAQHKDITKYKPFKTERIQQRRDFLRGRNGLLTWMEKHCCFCGAKSARSAILMNGVRCCGKCDREQWPDKITKTEARMKYDLKDEHLLPSPLVSPSAAKLLKKHPGLPQIRYGTYISTGVPTTMFLRKDVEAVAKLAHGDLKAHLAKRQADRDERRKKARDTKARKDAEAKAEKLRQERHENAEWQWEQMHKYHSITSYGDEAGPATPPMPSSPDPSTPGSKRKHKRALSIDSDAANEGRVITSPPKPKPATPITPRLKGVQRVEYMGVWDDVPSMFGMEESEWDALIRDQCPPTPPKPTVDTRGKYYQLEEMVRKPAETSREVQEAFDELEGRMGLGIKF